jgi:hypothetical protein
VDAIDTGADVGEALGHGFPPVEARNCFA